MRDGEDYRTGRKIHARIKDRTRLEAVRQNSPVSGYKSYSDRMRKIGVIPRTSVIRKPPFHFADTAVCIIFAHSNNVYS